MRTGEADADGERKEADAVLIVVAGVVLRRDRLMICRRRPGASNGLKWEFPGGKIEPGESPEEALARELMEELDVGVRVGRIADAVFFRYPERDVLALFYRCEITAGEPSAVDCDAIAWVKPGDLGQYDFAGADRAFVDRNF